MNRPHHSPDMLVRILMIAMSSLLLLQSCTATSPAYAEPVIPTLPADTTIYADALAAGWDNWSWDTTVNLAATTPVHIGSAAISVRYDKAWAGLYLHSDGGIDTAGLTHLTFWLNGGSGGQQIAVKLNGGDPAVTVTAPANTWARQSIALAGLGSPALIKDIYWQDVTGGAQPVFFLDDITFSGTTAPPAAIQLSVDAAAGRKPISPYIYGMNFVTETLAAELDLPVNRWGGNATTRYNYQNDYSNQARDWYFQNIKQSDASNLPADSAANRFIDQNRRTGTQSILTLPMTGYVANDVFKACGFDVRTFGNQQSVDPYEPHQCGNGVYPNGSLVTGNDPLVTSMKIGPTFSAGWLSFVKGKYGAAADGGVRFYNLDNEPDLWFDTHRDVRPTGWKCQAFLDDTVAYASAAKAADPGAQLLGPVVSGWTYYFYSAYDAQQQNWGRRTDCLEGGSPMDFVPWYLQQLRRKEPTTGRLLDYLDLHYYPQASGVSLSPAGNTATQALRLRSTLSLWDPTYVDESWIGSAGPEGGIVRLIPRMREWVNQYYPGTKLAITEYNWGGLESINGALAQADVLGIFGREGLDLATLWGSPNPDQPGAFAFRMYRNYDGAGSRFGDVSVRATSSDQGKVAVYAAQQGTAGPLTIMLVNKQVADATVELSLANFAAAGPAAVYRYSPVRLDSIVRAAARPLGNGSFSLPAQSITLLVVPAQPAAPPSHWLYLPYAERR